MQLHIVILNNLVLQALSPIMPIQIIPDHIASDHSKVGNHIVPSWYFNFENTIDDY